MRKYSIGVFFNVLNKNRGEWEKQAEFIKKLGHIEHVEVLLEEVHLNNKEKLILKNLLKNYRVIVHAPFIDITLLSPHKEIVEASMLVFQKAINIGQYLSAELMTIHAERYPHFWTEQQALKQMLVSAKTLAKKSDFPISIENLSQGGNTQIPYPVTIQQILRLAQVLSHNTALTIDIGHLLKDGADIFKVLKRTKNKIGDIHLHDGKKGVAHLRLGDGDLKLAQLINLLDNMRYQRFVTLEVMGEKGIVDSWKTLQKMSKTNLGG